MKYLKSSVKTVGYVLRITPYLNHDYMVYALTSLGFITFIAKGSYHTTSNKLSALIPFSKVKFELTKFEGSDNYSLKDGQSDEVYPTIYESLIKMNTLNLAAEITISLLTPEDEAPMNYFENFLRKLNDGGDPLTLLLIYFAHILSAAGIGFDVSGCVFCSSKTNLVAFSYTDGGLVCQKCAKERNIAPDSIGDLKLARYVFLCPAEKMGEIELRRAPALKLFNRLIQHLEMTLDLSLKYLDLFKESF